MEKAEQKSKVGNPAKDPDNPINRATTFKTSQKQLDEITELANSEGKTKGEIIRTAIDKYINSNN